MIRGDKSTYHHTVLLYFNIAFNARMQGGSLQRLDFVIVCKQGKKDFFKSAQHAVQIVVNK